MIRSMMIAALAAPAMLLAAASAEASTLYEQAYDGGLNAYASQNDSGSLGHFATAYDNFTLGNAATITGVAVTGSYGGFTAGTITGFTVSIYSDAAGAPDASLYSVSLAGNGGETFLQDSSGYPIYTYQFNVNFAATAGTTYWLAVVPDMTFPPQWFWSTGTGGDGTSVQDFLGSRSTVGQDLAFTLSGDAPVPEPASWAMMIGGFALVGGTLRSKRRAIRFA